MLTKRLAQFEVHFEALASIPMLVQGFSRFETVSCLLHNQWHLSQTKFRTLNSLLTVSQLVPQPWRPVRPLFQAVLARQDLGNSDIAMAPQPLSLSCPMAQDHLMTTETQDADLIPFSSPEDEHARSAVLLPHWNYEVDQYSLRMVQHTSAQ